MPEVVVCALFLWFAFCTWGAWRFYTNHSIGAGIYKNARAQQPTFKVTTTTHTTGVWQPPSTSAVFRRYVDRHRT